MQLNHLNKVVQQAGEKRNKREEVGGKAGFGSLTKSGIPKEFVFPGGDVEVQKAVTAEGATPKER